MKEKIDEKKLLKEGWIKSRMMIEVLAGTESAAKSALEKHVEKMEKEKNIFISNKIFHDIEKVDNPLPNIPTGYSYIVEIEIIAQTFEKLVNIVMNYGPSSIEILEPSSIKMDIGEAQGILNSLAAILHRFAASGAGGIVIGT